MRADVEFVSLWGDLQGKISSTIMDYGRYAGVQGAIGVKKLLEIASVRKSAFMFSSPPTIRRPAQKSLRNTSDKEP